MYQSKHSGGATPVSSKSPTCRTRERRVKRSFASQEVKCSDGECLYSTVPPEMDRGPRWSIDHAEAEQTS